MDERVLYTSNKAELQSPDERWTTMSITSPGKSILDDQKPRQKPFVIKDTNRTNDIDGAFAVPKYDQWATKQTNATLPGNAAPSKHHSRNVPDTSLYIDDIDGARFCPIGGMERTQRHVNPLKPNYKLPSYSVPQRPLEDAKSIRDPLLIADIDGTHPKAFAQTSTRDNISVNDIPGATANYRERARLALLQKTFGPNMISTGRKEFVPEELKRLTFSDRTMRRSDPLSPSYYIGGIEVSDDPIRSKPKRLKGFISGGTSTLRTEDIVGATPGRIKEKNMVRREYRNIMNTSDVEGAQADTVKHSIASTRITCPLSPVYKGLDYGQPLEPIIKPLIDSATMRSFGPASLRFLKQQDVALSHLASPISRRPSHSLASSQSLPSLPSSPTPTPPLTQREVHERQREIDAVRELGDGRW